MGNKKRSAGYTISVFKCELTTSTIMLNCAMFMYCLVTRVNGGYGIGGHGIKPLLKRSVDPGWSQRQSKSSQPPGKTGY